MNKEQEIQYKLAVFEQQIRQLQEQMQAVEEGNLELNNLNLGLEDLKNSKDKEILALVGRGIFVKAKIVSEELLVDIGSKNFVKKSIEESRDLINEQILKLKDIKKQLQDSLNNLEKEIENIFSEAN